MNRIIAAFLAVLTVVGTIFVLVSLVPETAPLQAPVSVDATFVAGEEDVTVDPTIAIYERRDADYTCELPAVADLYNGLVTDVIEFLVVSDEWFVEYMEVFDRPALAAAVHTEGVVRVPAATCESMQSDPNASRRNLVYFDLMVHEAAHALDFSLGWISGSIEFPVVDLGHASTFASPNRELFAFCVQQLTMGQDVHGNGRCPAANFAVTVEALEAELGIDAQEFVLDLGAYAPVSVVDPAQQLADAAMSQLTAGL